MNKQKPVEKIISVFNALNTIEVKGQHNVQSLGACIQIVQDVVNELLEDEQNQTGGSAE